MQFVLPLKFAGTCGAEELESLLHLRGEGAHGFGLLKPLQLLGLLLRHVLLGLGRGVFRVAIVKYWQLWIEQVRVPPPRSWPISMQMMLISR